MHIGIDRDELADQVAKEVTKSRKFKKKNRKSIKIDTSYISPFFYLLFLRSVVKTYLKEKLFAE